MRTRVIPVLLLTERGLVKSVQFKDERYVGDPINALKIFNDKEVDELFLIDIEATKKNVSPRFDYLRELATECFMPMGYGGGIKTPDDIKRILQIGYEKICLQAAALENPRLIESAAREFGSQAVVVCIDVKRSFLGGYKVVSRGSSKVENVKLLEWAKHVEECGAGEIIIQSVDRDGTMKGYDTEVIKSVSEAVSIPVVALGGAASVDHFKSAIQSGASAVAAGSMFVFYGQHRAVLINYPKLEGII